MKVLMLNSNRFREIPAIPFGMCCVAAAIEDAGHDVKALDLFFSKSCASDISKVIKEYNPEVIGITIRNLDNGSVINPEFLLEPIKKDIIAPLKDMFSGTIIIGGPAVGINGPEMLSYFDLKFAIRGDGEAAIVEFLKRLENNIPMDGMEGLIMRDGDLIVEDNPPMYVKDIDSLPFAKPYKYVDVKAYKELTTPLQIQTKRGCVLKCTYCTYNRIEGTEYRKRNPQCVADEIEHLVKETGINHIGVMDSIFNLPLSHAKDVLRAIADKKMDLKLTAMEISPAGVDQEFVDLLKKFKIEYVIMCAEAGSDTTLKGLGKNFTKADVFRAAKLLRKAKITMIWSLLLGAPGETEETVMETLDTIKKASSMRDIVSIAVGIRIYHKTPISEMIELKKNYYPRDNYLFPASYTPEGISMERMRYLAMRAALTHPNYYLLGMRGPSPFLISTTKIINRILRMNQNPFIIHMVLKRLQNLMGMGFIKRLIFDHKNKDLLEHA